MRSHLIHIPPLRERKDDLPLLLDQFLGEAAEDFQKNKPTMPKELPVLLANYHFPGNLRELKSMVYDAVSMHKDKVLSMDQFKKNIDFNNGSTAGIENCVISGELNYFNPNVPLPSLQQVEHALVEEALRRTEGNQSIASKLLGISQPALSKRVKKMRLAAENMMR